MCRSQVLVNSKKSVDIIGHVLSSSESRRKLSRSKIVPLNLSVDSKSIIDNMGHFKLVS